MKITSGLLSYTQSSFSLSPAFQLSYPLISCPGEAGNMVCLELRGFLLCRTSSAKNRQSLANWDEFGYMKANKIECLTEGKQQVNKQSQFWIKFSILLAIMIEKSKQQQTHTK